MYIDESGDLGLGKRGSKNFIITCVKISDDKTNDKFRRISKKIRQRKLKKRMKRSCELKFSNCDNTIRQRFLNHAVKLDLEVYTICIPKEYMNHDLRDNLPVLYNYLIKILLEKIVIDLDRSKQLHIILDKTMSRSQRDNFESYIKTQFFSVFQTLPDLIIEHKSSQLDEGLHVIDFICGAFGYKYNSGKSDNTKYTEILGSKIKLEKTDLFRENANPA